MSHALPLRARDAALVGAGAACAARVEGGATGQRGQGLRGAAVVAERREQRVARREVGGVRAVDAVEAEVAARVARHDGARSVERAGIE